MGKETVVNFSAQIKKMDVQMMKELGILEFEIPEVYVDKIVEFYLFIRKPVLVQIKVDNVVYSLGKFTIDALNTKFSTGDSILKLSTPLEDLDEQFSECAGAKQAAVRIKGVTNEDEDAEDTDE